MDKHLKIFKALGDKTRLRIVMMLKKKAMCVCEIRQVIGSSMSTISNHLKILKEAGIIDFLKEDRYINYELNDTDEIVQKILTVLIDLDDDKEIKKDAEEAFKSDRLNIC